MKKLLNNTKFLVIIFIILLGTSAYLGYLILQKHNKSEIPVEKPGSVIIQNGEKKTVLEGEDFLLKTKITEKSTDEEKIRYAYLLKKHAKKVSTIEFNTCKPTPLIAEAESGATITLRNNDDVTRNLRLYSIKGEIKITLNAKEEKSFTLSSEKDVVNYSYFCDYAPSLSGFILVTHKNKSN